MGAFDGSIDGAKRMGSYEWEHLMAPSMEPYESIRAGALVNKNALHCLRVGNIIKYNRALEALIIFSSGKEERADESRKNN